MADDSEWWSKAPIKMYQSGMRGFDVKVAGFVLGKSGHQGFLVKGARYVARQIGEDPDEVSKSLKRLERFGVVTLEREKDGGQYAIQAHNPAYDPAVVWQLPPRKELKAHKSRSNPRRRDNSPVPEHSTTDGSTGSQEGDGASRLPTDPQVALPTDPQVALPTDPQVAVPTDSRPPLSSLEMAFEDRSGEGCKSRTRKSEFEKRLSLILDGEVSARVCGLVRSSEIVEDKWSEALCVDCGRIAPMHRAVFNLRRETLEVVCACEF